MSTPKSISLSLCRRTNQEFRGCSHYESESLTFKVFDELCGESKDQIYLENRLEYLRGLVNDYR